MFPKSQDNHQFSHEKVGVIHELPLQRLPVVSIFCFGLTYREVKLPDR